MMHAVKIRVSAFVANNRRNSVLRALARGARSYVAAYENYNYDIESNGEGWFLRRIAAANPGIVFDVGANVGDWTAAVCAVSPAADIHSFELVRETAERLRVRFADNPSVHVVDYGLSDEAGSAKIKSYLGSSTLNSLQDYPHEVEHEWIEGKVQQGDDYCERLGIERIDLLKIDTEGADHRVLAGFSRMLEARRIAAIQFEYGRTAIVNKFLLRDFYNLLSGYGMVIGKLYPNYVHFRDYDMRTDEDFIGPNFVAIRRDRRDLLQLLDR